MLLTSILIGVAFFLIVVLVAAYIGMKVQKPEEPAPSPLIHASGIYSIVRRSPRDGISEFKPNEQDIRQYLASKNEDIDGKYINAADKEALISHWRNSIESNIREVEAGDHQGIEFYFYEFSQEDSVCKGKIENGHFVSREEIFKHPHIIPPFHIGCRCTLKAHHGSEDLRETTQLGMRPLFRNEKRPVLPEWTETLTLS